MPESERLGQSGAMPPEGTVELHLSIEVPFCLDAIEPKAVAS